MMPRSNLRRRSTGTSLLCLVGIVVLAQCFTQSATAQELPSQVKVAAIEAPPFSMKAEDGQWHGLGFDLLSLAAADLGLQYEVVEFTEVREAVDALEAGDLDITVALAVRERAERRLDLTLPYYRSGLGIAVASQTATSGWLRGLKSSDWFEFLWLLISLVLLWFLAGAAVWAFERRANASMFGGSTAAGLGHGVWWAAVTMTTVGYGDKAPSTLGGRLVAVVWMFASIILLSYFTASISASLTADRLVGKVTGVQDLPRVRVGAMGETAATAWLESRRIVSRDYTSVEQGLLAIAEDQIDAFIFDEAVLKNVVALKFSEDVAVLPDSFKHYYVGMAVQNDSPLREPLNLAILRIMADEEWQRLLDRNIPATP